MKQVLYTPQGVWKFYHDEKGICFYAPGSTTPMQLFEKGASDFDTACDEKGNLFLICQDDRNNLYLFYFDRKKWSKQCVLESKSVVPYNKHFRLFCTNGWVHAFYNIRHDGQYLLVHQILNEKEKPSVIENRNAPFCYTVVQDSKQNAHVIYEKSGLQQKTFSWQSKSWSEPTMLREISGELISVQGIFDEEDHLHLVYCRRNKTEYAVCYTNKNIAQVVLSGLENDPEPIILKDDTYHILFRMAGRLLQSSAVHPKEGFFKPQYYFPGSFSPHTLFRLKCSVPLPRYRLFVNTVYGTESRPDKFDITLIGEKMQSIDYQLPETPVEKPSELALYMQEISDFSSDQACQNQDADIRQQLADMETRLSALEQQIKNADSK